MFPLCSNELVFISLLGDGSTKLKSVIYHLVATLKEIAILIRPLMQDTSNEILNQLGLDTNVTWEDLNNYKEIKDLKVAEKGVPIFMRLNVEDEVSYINQLMKS